MPPRFAWAFAAIATALAFLYLFHLDAVGVLGPDEPRYAAIGRAMAQSGDWITPRLWGSAWFEKPPLLYWLTAAGTQLGLNPDLCGRLPVALLSLGFLAASAIVLRAEYGLVITVYTVALSATSAGWLAFSGLCLTDIPMAACYALAMFLVLRLFRAPSHSIYAVVGALLGLAALAKGLVPIALVLPALWFLRRQWRYWPTALFALLLVALPWYLSMYARNGQPFIQEFFLKHHFQRLYSASLQHVQPLYYYIPVLIGALFPWTPLFFMPSIWRQPWDGRRRFLLTTVVFGFVLFSISRNKLPGYLLPLLPLCFLFLASGLPTLRRSVWIAPGLLIAMLPLLAPMLPASLAQGRISMTAIAHLPFADWLYVAVPLLVLIFARHQLIAPLLLLCLVANGIFLKATDYPAMDVSVSPRSLWRATQQYSPATCNFFTDRNWIYGLNYYRGSAFPPCDDGGHYLYQFRSTDRTRPELVPMQPH